MEYPIQLVEKVSINVHVTADKRMTADKGTLPTNANKTDILYRQLNDIPFQCIIFIHTCFVLSQIIKYNK